MNPAKFLRELQRRNVYRAAVGYGAVAWLIIQVATQTLPFFDAPTWAVRSVILLLIAGFPFALVWAWMFEVTAEGVVRTEDVPVNSAATRATGRKIDFIIIAVLVVTVALLLFDRYNPKTAEKSIAVLPFENMSDDKENAFFADGIQDDILTSLAKIRDLKVISRTSVMGFRAGDKARNLRDIGKALGVAHILEGSVRRSANRVKVTVQLIDTSDDRHLWAEAYDRTISDALSLQGELATEIAAALRATLSPEEKVRVEQKPTENAEAYVLYLRARQLEINPDTLLQDFKEAVRLYGEAVKIDPAFALAHARLSATAARIYHFYEPVAVWKDRAQSEARESLRLQLNLGEGYFALGLSFYWLESDYQRALVALQRAAELLPNDSEIGLIVAAIARRQGRWTEALETFRKAEDLDPQNANVVRNLVYTFSALRRWPEAARAAERWVAIAPTSIAARTQAGYIQYLGTGKTDALDAFLAATPDSVDPDGAITSVRWDVAMIKRDFAAAAATIAKSPLAEFSYLNGDVTPKSYFTGCTALARGDSVDAQSAFESARVNLERAVEEAPESATRHANLGLLYALMGRRDEAIREGRRAVELQPETQDAVDGTLMNSYLALIYTRVGERDAAFALLEQLVRTPGASDTVQYSVTVQDLRHRWEWDPLRDDPRFRSLIGDQVH